MREGDRARLAAVVAERQRADARDGYRIGPDDLLDIRIPDLIPADASARTQDVTRGSSGSSASSIADTPAFQQGVRVSSRGDVSLPYLGLVRVEGFTPTELEADLNRRLREAGILRNPQVSVQIAEYRSQVLAVIGSVEKPGLYPLTRPGATLADMIWAAGGPSKDAGRAVDFAPGKGATPIRIDLEMLLETAGTEFDNMNPRVQVGDVINVAPAGSVTVDGWVDKPGAYPVTRGLTLTGAVAAAGGRSFAADPRHVSVKRSLGGAEQELFTVDLQAIAEGLAADFPLTDGDVVRLPASVVRLVPWGLWNAAKEVFHIGGSVLLF